MKLSTFLAASLVLAASLFSSQSFAQSRDKAADKQKQANLEKIKAHQAELHNKDNSLTPEQAAEAKKKADAYKRGGYKQKENQGPKTAPAVNNPQPPDAKPAQHGVGAKPPTQVSQTGTKAPGSAGSKPVFLDASGKPLDKNVPAKQVAASAIKPVRKAPASNTGAAKVKTPAAETIKK